MINNKYIIGDILTASYSLEYVVTKINKATYDLTTKYELDKSVEYPSIRRIHQSKLESYRYNKAGHMEVSSAKNETIPTVKINDIFVNSWGYDQTNIDFYQVVKVSASGKTISIQRMSGKILEETSNMSYKVMPGLLKKDSDIMTKKVSSYRGKATIGFNHGAGYKWDGKPERMSCYA
jgi:hypothetical protein